MTSNRAAEPRPDDDLVDPPDPAVWEGAMRCDICGHIEVHANHAATPAPREDGWEELRREIEALPPYRDAMWGPFFGGVRRDAVLAIVSRLAAARGEPEPDVERLLTTLRDRFHEARAGTPEWRDGIRLGLEIAMNEVGYWATPTTPEPDQ